MPSPAKPSLAYESRLPAALWPGEKVLWESTPRGRSARRARWLISIWLLVVLAAGAGALFAEVRLERIPRLMIAGCFVALAAVVIGGAMWMPERTEPAKSVYRVTDRRVVGVTEDPKRSVTAVSLRRMQRMTSERPAGRDNAVVSFYGDGAARFEDVNDSLGLSQLVLGLRRSARSKRAGRRQKRERAMQMRAAVQPSQIEPVPSEAAIQEGETILWTGRPRVREPHDGKWWKKRIVIVAWMTVPIALVVAHFSEWAQQYVNVHIVVLLLAMVWIAMSLNALMLTPLREARRRARTRYFLTSDRAIIIESGPGRRRVQSIFLDSFYRVALELRSTGAEDVGDVHTGYGITFALIDHPAEVHALVTQAIGAARRAAGDLPINAEREDDPI